MMSWQKPISVHRTARDHSPAHPTRPSPLIARRTLSTMSATLVRASALGLGAGLPRRKTFTCGSDRVRAVSGVGTKKRTSSLRVVAEDTDWGRELSSAVVRVGAGVLMVHNGLDKLVDPEVRRDAGVHKIADCLLLPRSHRIVESKRPDRQTDERVSFPNRRASPSSWSSPTWASCPTTSPFRS